MPLWEQIKQKFTGPEQAALDRYKGWLAPDENDLEFFHWVRTMAAALGPYREVVISYLVDFRKKFESKGFPGAEASELSRYFVRLSADLSEYGHKTGKELLEATAKSIDYHTPDQAEQEIRLYEKYWFFDIISTLPFPGLSALWNLFRSMPMSFAQGLKLVVLLSLSKDKFVLEKISSLLKEIERTTAYRSGLPQIRPRSIMLGKDYSYNNRLRHFYHYQVELPEQEELPQKLDGINFGYSHWLARERLEQGLCQIGNNYTRVE